MLFPCWLFIVIYNEVLHTPSDTGLCRLLSGNPFPLHWLRGKLQLWEFEGGLELESHTSLQPQLLLNQISPPSCCLFLLQGRPRQQEQQVLGVGFHLELLSFPGLMDFWLPNQCSRNTTASHSLSLD